MQFTWNVDPILFHFGPNFGLRYYGLLFSCVFVGGFFLFRWQVRRAGGSEDDAYGILLPGALGTIIGARLGHVFFYEFDHFLADPLWALQIWQGGLASHGALIGLLAAIYYYARKNKQSYIECMDRFSFSAALGATLVRIGNFFNSEIVGRVTNGDWGVRFPLWDGAQAPLRHPSQLYEAALGLLVMLVLYFGDLGFGKEKRPRGALAALFLIVYFSGRFIVEYFKEYQVMSSGFPLTMGQILSIPAVAGGACLLYYSLKKGTASHWNLPEPVKAVYGKSSSKKGKKKSSRSNRKKK